MDKRRSHEAVKAACVLLVCLLPALPGCAAADNQVDSGRIYDNNGVYSIDKDGWDELWLDVGALSEYEFAAVTGQTVNGGEKPRFPVAVYDTAGQLGDEVNPAYGTVQVKGAQPYRTTYRSFKINLEGESLWHGNRTFVLYKCPDDIAKISMKLTLDAFALFDDIVSVHSGFTRLYIRDGGGYKDYGLYTFTENPGARYLRTHGLDRYGELYEAKDFDFSLDTWQRVDEAGREELIEYKNGEDPDKLPLLLLALDLAEDFDAVFERYFDRENYLTWLAGSALLGNRKAGTDSFYLYSPSDSEKWYFLPCPTDDLLWEEADAGYKIPAQQMGLGMFTTSKLHARFLEDADNRADLAEKVRELRGVLTDEVIAGLCGQYKEVLAEFVGREPDYTALYFSPRETEDRINRIPALVERNCELFFENLELPMPFDIYGPEQQAGGWSFHWQRREQPEGALPVTYHFSLCTDLGGKEVVFRADTQEPRIFVAEPLSGAYYLHLTASYDGGQSAQPANSWIPVGGGRRAWGVALYQLTHSEGVREDE